MHIILNMEVLFKESIYWKSSPEITCKLYAHAKTNNTWELFKILGK